MNERKTPTAELRQTPTNDKEGGWGDEEAKAKLVAEQARIQQHYKRLVQQRKDYEQSGGDLVDEVYQGGAERPERSDHKESLPASLAAARPGSRSGITGTSSDPRFGNYNDEIQRHLNRRQAQYHSQVEDNRSMCGVFLQIILFQRREHPARSDRPVSNFYEYESVQSNISHGRQTSQTSTGSGGLMHPPGLPVTRTPPRHEMPPPPPRTMTGPHYPQQNMPGGSQLGPCLPYHLVI